MTPHWVVTLKLNIQKSGVQNKVPFQNLKFPNTRFQMKLIKEMRKRVQ